MIISREKLANLCQWLKNKSFVICCGIAPVILLCALFITSDFGCNVIVDGEVVATSPSKEHVHSLIDSINDEFAPYLGGIKTIDVNLTTTPKLVFGKKFTPSQELGEILKGYSPYMEKAYTVKSNGKTVVGFKNKSERKKTYDKFIKEMTAGSSSYSVSDKVSFEHELVPYGLIKSGDNARKMLERTYAFNDTVTVKGKTSLSDILTAYAMTESDFMNLNPDYTPGKTSKVRINSEIPYIRVVTTQKYTENTLVRYTVKYEMDNTIYEGNSEIKKEGLDGFKKVSKTSYAVNGNSVYTHAGKPQIKEAITEVVLVGTKESPKGKTTGTFVNPSSGVLSSRFGRRDGRLHKGIDLCGDVGSDIYAADGGTVTFAGWDKSGYGNMVTIEHENGYTSLYAHCNKIYVSEGEKVTKGDVIAALGNTGRSTGPHLHFEVIETESGKAIDPISVFNIPVNE